jgi:hypothetical protein
MKVFRKSALRNLGLAAILASALLGYSQGEVAATCGDCVGVDRPDVWYCEITWISYWCPEFKYGDKEKCDNSDSEQDCSESTDSSQLDWEEWECLEWSANGGAGWTCTVTATGELEWVPGVSGSNPASAGGSIYSSCSFTSWTGCNCTGCQPDRHMGLQTCN